MNIPRPEHPEPQWERKSWRNLNGEWEFEFDFGQSARDRKIWEKEKLDKTIIVPFCPESKLSGIGYTDFIDGVVYKRHFEISSNELSKNILLHFGAVDYEADIYVNRIHAGSHKGGYTSFAIDITALLSEGDNELCVIVRDDVRSGLQCAGKQAILYASSGCDYTRTTGIWQTVWLEFVPKKHIASARYYTDIENGILTVEGEVSGSGMLCISAEFEGKPMGAAKIKCGGGFFAVSLTLDELHLWEPGAGRLYDLTLSFEEDTVKSYFGMRSVAFSGNKFTINNKTVFQRTVLDQGFYPDGIYTAPSDEALENDIHLSLAAGFNGARLHEKVFEARFLYHCDRLGYFVWEEYPNWKLDHGHDRASEIYVNEWSEVIERDFNHPSIIGWCPFNETWGYKEAEHKNALISTVYKLTKRLDKTRPCIDTSGNYHVISEIYDIHDYDNPVGLKARWDKFSELKKENGIVPAGCELFTNTPYPFHSFEYKNNMPIFISEFGGIQWNEDGTVGWGYGDAPKTKEAFIERFRATCEVLLQNADICGFCYTQLYDIEQEINGLYTYSRAPKFDMNVIKEILTKKAAIEE